MQFPGEKNAEFTAILPFTPASKNNMIGWMAARSDGAAYGYVARLPVSEDEDLSMGR